MAVFLHVVGIIFLINLSVIFYQQKVNITSFSAVHIYCFRNHLGSYLEGILRIVILRLKILVACKNNQ